MEAVLLLQVRHDQFIAKTKHQQYNTFTRIYVKRRTALLDPLRCMPLTWVRTGPSPMPIPSVSNATDGYSYDCIGGRVWARGLPAPLRRAGVSPDHRS